MTRKSDLATKYSKQFGATLQMPLMIAWVHGYEQARQDAAELVKQSSWKALADRVMKVGEQELPEDPKKPWRVDG